MASSQSLLNASTSLNLDSLPDCGVREIHTTERFQEAELTRCEQTICVAGLLSTTPCDTFNTTCLCEALDLENPNPFLLCVARLCSVPENLCTRPGMNLPRSLAYTCAVIKNYTVNTCENPTAPRLRSISVAFLVLFGVQTVFFALRMLTRVLKLSKWGWDDATIIVAFLATIGVITGRQLQLKAGMGQDIWTLTHDEIDHYIKIFWVFGMVYTVTLTLVKVSICFLYLRLFTNPKFRRIVWITQAFNVALMITFIFCYAFQCTPPDYFWKRWQGHGVHHGHCLSFSVLSWTHSGINIALDLWMLGLPFWQVTKLNLPLRKRMDAFVMFGCGIL